MKRRAESIAIRPTPPPNTQRRTPTFCGDGGEWVAVVWTSDPASSRVPPLPPTHLGGAVLDEGVEERGLAHVGQPDDARLERHARDGTGAEPPDGGGGAGRRFAVRHTSGPTSESPAAHEGARARPERGATPSDESGARGERHAGRHRGRKHAGITPRARMGAAPRERITTIGGEVKVWITRRGTAVAPLRAPGVVASPPPVNRMSLHYCTSTALRYTKSTTI